MEKIIAKAIYYTAVIITIFACIGFFASFEAMVISWKITLFPFAVCMACVSWIVAMCGLVYALDL
jgi:Na+/glutamate symporter